VRRWIYQAGSGVLMVILRKGKAPRHLKKVGPRHLASFDLIWLALNALLTVSTVWRVPATARKSCFDAGRKLCCVEGLTCFWRWIRNVLPCSESETRFRCCVGTRFYSQCRNICFFSISFPFCKVTCLNVTNIWLCGEKQIFVYVLYTI